MLKLTDTGVYLNIIKSSLCFRPNQPEIAAEFSRKFDYVPYNQMNRNDVINKGGNTIRWRLVILPKRLRRAKKRVRSGQTSRTPLGDK